MLGFGTIGQFAIGQVGAATAEVITIDKWYVNFVDPPRSPVGLNAPQQAALFFDPVPVVSFSWFAALSEPPRALPRSPAALSPFFSMQPAPSPFVATGWFQALSEPVRFPQGLKPPQQMVTAIDTQPVPITKIMPWFGWLAEPLRFQIGTYPPRQEAFSMPPRLMPKPAKTGVLNALETKDVFFGGARSWNRVSSAEVGAIEALMPTVEIGLSEANAPSGEAAVIEQAVSPTPGSAVAAIFAASISVREV